MIRSYLHARRQAAAQPPEVVERLDRQHGRIAAVERDLARIGPQVAALEARLESLRDLVETTRAAGGSPQDGTAQDAAGLDVLDEVRREHERMRARVSAAARFEERLRQLEERLDRFELTDS
ncbi:MAG: hypothetical protein ACXVEV_07925 [Nocardioidaceae bacterium]